MDRIGLIAGGGELPIVFVKEIKKNNRYVVAFAFEEETDTQLANIVDEIYWLEVGQIQQIFETLKKLQIKEIVMIGRVKHSQLFANLSFDSRAEKLLSELDDKRANTILLHFIEELTNDGIRVLPTDIFFSRYLATEGVYTKTQPTESQIKDIKFGYSLAKEIARLDIGQTIVVKNGAVIAVEAMEGTDECIIRSGKICDKGIVVVKVARPNQDLRFDLPVIGPQTLVSLRNAKAEVLAVESGKTIILDKEDFIFQADKSGLVVLGL